MQNEKTSAFMARFSAACMTLQNCNDQLYLWTMVDGLLSRELQKEVRKTLLQHPNEYCTIPKVQTLVLQLELAYDFGTAAAPVYASSSSHATATKNNFFKNNANSTQKTITAANTEAAKEGETAPATTAFLAALTTEQKQLMTEGRCFGCKVKGHIRKECPERKQKKQE